MVFRDKRHIDPDTYQPRPGTQTPAAPDPVGPAGTGAAAGAAADAAEEPHPLVAESERVLELTADLQRLSAEYANYRKRVDRDREAQRELTIAAVMNDVLPVFDDMVGPASMASSRVASNPSANPSRPSLPRTA